MTEFGIALSLGTAISFDGSREEAEDHALRFQQYIEAMFREKGLFVVVQEKRIKPRTSSLNGQN